MCGICGIWFKGTGRVPTKDLLVEMTSTLRHRGPDEGGEEVVGDTGFGHRRLKIIDLSTGQQPMCNEDKSVWIVFNGEIYNFQDLRKDLLANGHKFVSRSDTEVLVHLYEEHGVEMTKFLRGMFAFAIWDSRLRKLFLCRDRLGIKPLYFWNTSEFIAFSSELKTLLPLSQAPLPIRQESISDYFTFGYVPAPATPFEGPSKLEPAQFLLCDANSVTLQKYWAVTKTEGVDVQVDVKLAELIDDAVRIRLGSDVPFGAFLSGGVDSSVVCAYMQKHLPSPLKTFSIGFPVDRFNELPFAQQVADHLGTEHYSKVVTPDAIGLLPKLAWHFDEPFADSSAIPMWYVSELAREQVTMTHSGDGGDELFGGYTRYFKELRVQNLAKNFPTVLITHLINILNLMPNRVSPFQRHARALSRFRLSPIERYKAAVGICINPFEKVLHENIRGKTTGFFDSSFIAAGFKGQNVDLTMLGLVDVQTYLPEDILTKVDRMSMAHSLEARVPLLDHKLVEFAFSLDESFKKSSDGGGKRILKELAATLVPSQAINRRKKGFGVPLSTWFRNELRNVMLDLHAMPNHPSFDFVDRRELQLMIESHLSGKFDHAERLWAIIMFQFWTDIYVANRRPTYSFFR